MARALQERPAHDAGGEPSRGCRKRAEAEAVLESAFQSGGEQAVNRFRDQARELAPALDAETEFAVIDQIAGALLGSRPGPVETPSALARLAGEPYDVDREQVFHMLFAALRAQEAPNRVNMADDPTSFATVAFFDAYFSNFIEGTEFAVDEARAIVFEGRIPRRGLQTRTMCLAPTRSSAAEQRCRGASPPWRRSRPLSTIFAQRTTRSWRNAVTSAGDSHFVAPADVVDTLRIGFDLVRALPLPFERAEQQLTATHAFERPRSDVRLIMPPNVRRTP